MTTHTKKVIAEQKQTITWKKKNPNFPIFVPKLFSSSTSRRSRQQQKSSHFLPQNLAFVLEPLSAEAATRFCHP